METVLFILENKFFCHLLLILVVLSTAVLLFFSNIGESIIYFIIILPIIGHKLLKMRGILMALIYAFIIIILYFYLNVNVEIFKAENLILDVSIFSNLIVMTTITFLASIFAVMAQEKMVTEITKTSKENYAMEGLLSVVGTCYKDDIQQISLSVKDILKNSKEYEVPQAEKEIINNFKRATSQLSEIVTQVNCVKDIERVVVENRAVTICSTDIIDRVDFTFYSRLKAKKLQLIGSSNFDMVLLKTNVSILHNHIINNIISNAIKFSRENSEIKIDISLESSEVIITISDSGIGIPREDLEKVLSFFNNYSKVGTGGELGTGFGVALAVYYTNLIGGVLTIDSRSIDDFPNDHGTTFTIRLSGGSSV
jgi:signal transduction histidine kinase